MTRYVPRADAEALLAEFAAYAEPEARRRLAAHSRELAEILHRDGHRAFCSRWFDLVTVVMGELDEEFRERLNAMAVEWGSA